MLCLHCKLKKDCIASHYFYLHSENSLSSLSLPVRLRLESGRAAGPNLLNSQSMVIYRWKTYTKFDLVSEVAIDEGLGIEIPLLLVWGGGMVLNRVVRGKGRRTLIT